MRIIGRIPHPVMQISVFSNDGRWPVQFELDGRTQIYRFRHCEALKNLADVRQVVEGEFAARVLEQFRGMRAIHQDALAALAEDAANDTDDLPLII